MSTKILFFLAIFLKKPLNVMEAKKLNKRIDIEVLKDIVFTYRELSLL